MAKKKKDTIMDFDFGGDEEEDLGKEEVGVEDFKSNVLSANNMSVFNACDLHGALRVITFRVEADKDYANGTSFALCRMPQSQIRILGDLCKFDFSLSGKSAILGWSKFKKRNQMIIPTDLTGFGKVEEMKGVQSFLGHLNTRTISVDSLEGIFLICTVEGAGKKGDFIEGYLIYIKQ